MSQIVEVRGLKIGEGIPKICVPITGVDKEAILKEALEIQRSETNIVEWRVDFLERENDFHYIKEILRDLRKILVDIPLLFTYRTKHEGGNGFMKAQEYEALCNMAASTADIDLIDIEIFSYGTKILIEEMKKKDIKVIGSNHDFEKTPRKEEIVKRLRHMQKLGVDIGKIAVMPVNKEDVIELLSATLEMQRYYNSTPVITMSMGKMGVLSRTVGEFFGSAVTFGIVNKSSAPGQILIDKLLQSLQIMHEAGTDI
jgi:3-dehydroquinate dehydratase, type I